MSRSSVIANGFDVVRLAPDTAVRARQRLAWQVPSGHRIVGTIARWDLSKDHATLSQALRQLTNTPDRLWTAVWVGEGMTDDNAELVALLHRDGIRDRVILQGPTDDPSAVGFAVSTGGVIASLVGCESQPSRQELTAASARAHKTNVSFLFDICFIISILGSL